MSKILIKQGEIVQPKGQKGIFDILIEDDKIVEIAPTIQAEEATMIDATDQLVSPGFVDMHVHLREPGQEYKEDIASGSLAAVHGGYTSIACMPNTKPVNDDITITAFIKDRARKANRCHVYPVAAITKGLKGEELTEMGLLLREGVVAFSDDGKPVGNAQKMRLALEYSQNFDALLMQHCEEMSLAEGGLMNEGLISYRIGLKGIPASAESIMVGRDIELVREYGGRLHFCHISTKASLDLIRQAKKEGLMITCETAPHYFAADETWVEERFYDPNTKMNPPLRSKADVEAIVEAIQDGTIDAIATDHAPHHPDEKNVEFASALNGIIGLETAFSLGYTYLVKTGRITLERLVECMSTRPAQLLRIEAGEIKVGAVADIVILDEEQDVIYTEETLHGKSKNTPFLHTEYKGKIVQTIVAGKPQWD